MAPVGFSGYTPTKDSPTPVPRRLVDLSVFEARSPTSHSDTHQTMPNARDSHQLGKVISDSVSVDDLFGHGDSIASFEGFPISGSSDKPSCSSYFLPRQQSSPSFGMDFAPGTYGVPHSHHFKLQKTHEKLSDSTPQDLGSSVSTRLNLYSLELRYS